MKRTTNSLFERPSGGEKAVLVHINLPETTDPEDFEEFRELVISAGAKAVAVVTGSRSSPEVKYFVGSGKVEEIKHYVASSEAELVLFNHSLTPSQERNLESFLQCRVLDRTGLILDIFAQRARTFEGKLQVELAQLRHLLTRLVHGWTHLERQKGGIGLRGPGEKQLETDRRLIRSRIKSILGRLEKVRRHRAQGRRARNKAEMLTVSIVGYTNAGKSALFNYLTQASVYTADQLFATLDPTLRAIQLPKIGRVILADTVGFIRHLPHDLIDAFRATLEETQQSDLLLHVIDASHRQRDLLIEDVNEVLVQIGADRIPQLKVFNKLDLLPQRLARIDRDANGMPQSVWVSAVTGEGIELLLQALIEVLSREVVSEEIELSSHEGNLRSMLYELGAVVSEKILEHGWHLSIRLQKKDYERLMRYHSREC